MVAQAKASEAQKGAQQPGQGHEPRFLRQRRRAHQAVNHQGGAPFTAGIFSFLAL